MGDTRTLSAGPVDVVVDTDGCRIVSFVHGRHELLRQHDPHPLTHGWYPMVPYAGRVAQGIVRHEGASFQLPVEHAAPHAIHGIAHTSPWTVVGTDEATWLVMRCALDDRWPFGGVVRADIVVRPDGLDWTLTVTAADRSMPVQVGWHPWWRRHIGRGEVRLDLAAKGMWQRGPDGTTTGRIQPVARPPWDDAFSGVSQPVTLRWPELTLEMRSDCDTWVVYTEPADAICVEPQSGPPDAFRHRPEVIEPGESFRRTMSVRLVPRR